MEKRAPPVELASDSETRESLPTWVVCATCGARITLSASAVAIRGAHVHELVNPSAITFVVRCFSTAPGCMPIGERSKEWTWFPGYEWQIELCRACASHLGWSYHGQRRFYGLIRDAIAET